MTSSSTNHICFCPQDIPWIHHAQHNVTHNILLSQRTSKKTMHQPKKYLNIHASVSQDVSCDIFVSQTTLATPHIATCCNLHVSNSKWHVRNYALHVISPGVHAAPHVIWATNGKTFRRGTVRKKLGCVASRCHPRVSTWTLWNTMFYVTSLKNALKFAMFSHVQGAFFSCLAWRILGDVPENNLHVKLNAHSCFFWRRKKQRFLIVFVLQKVFIMKNNHVIEWKRKWDIILYVQTWIMFGGRSDFRVRAPQ